jgi:transposase InsO family protein
MRDFDVEAPNTAWVTDITYLATLEGWLYAVILDLFSRRVVGYAMSERIDRELVLEALRKALVQRPGTRDLIHHSDRGSQYASHDYREALDQAGITCSMSRRGDCWDNAVAESFFGLHRDLLQRPSAPFVAGLPKPAGVRAEERRARGLRPRTPVYE